MIHFQIYSNLICDMVRSNYNLQLASIYWSMLNNIDHELVMQPTHMVVVISSTLLTHDHQSWQAHNEKDVCMHLDHTFCFVRFSTTLNGLYILQFHNLTIGHLPQLNQDLHTLPYLFNLNLLHGQVKLYNANLGSIFEDTLNNFYKFVNATCPYGYSYILKFTSPQSLYNCSKLIMKKKLIAFWAQKQT